jgi:hypothetical protein
MDQHRLVLDLLQFRSSSDIRRAQRASIVSEIKAELKRCPDNAIFYNMFTSQELDNPNDDEFLKSVSRHLKCTHPHESFGRMDEGRMLTVIAEACVPSKRQKTAHRADDAPSLGAPQSLPAASPASSSPSCSSKPLTTDAMEELLNVYNNADLCADFEVGRAQQDVHELFMSMPKPLLDLCAMKRLRVVKEFKLDDGCAEIESAEPEPPRIDEEDLYLEYTAHDARTGCAARRGLMRSSNHVVAAADQKPKRMRSETSFVLSFGRLFVLQSVIFDAQQRKMCNLEAMSDHQVPHTIQDLNGKFMYLVAIIRHIGDTRECGHYATSLHFESDIVVANDERIERLGAENRGTPYLILYAPRRIQASEYTVTGLQNIGNTCFVNSLMQALRMAIRCL